VTYEFGDFELDTTRRVLTSRTDGQPVDITGRVLDALIHLVERPGQLIEKRALIEALWPNVVVEDGNLSQTIHALRRVLGEKAGEHRYIATVPGRGYQFVAEVKERVAAPAALAALAAPAPFEPIAPPRPEPPPAVAPSRRPTWLLAGGVLVLLLLGGFSLYMWTGRDQPAAMATTVPAHPSIAVLPFVDMSEEQDQAHFADGLSEEILNLLAHAENLRVTARTSSFSFKGENADIKTIAQRLGVAYVLEGSVRKAGDRLRITAQLIDASTSAHVWSETYDRDVHDIFGVQREIATAVAGAMRVSLGRETPRRAETTSAEAYEHYLQGRFLFNRRAPGDLLQAKSHFDAAIGIDPAYARAWSGLAGVYFVSRYENIELPDEMKNWSRAIERAVALGPELAEGHVRAAQYYWHVGKQEIADGELARATALDPQEPLVLSATMSEAIVDGRMADAAEMQRRIVAIDPLSASNRGNLGTFLMSVGRLPEAQAELERSLELSPASEYTTTQIADVLILQGRGDEALAVISRIPDGYLRYERLAMVHFARGETREGEEVLARMLALAKQPDFDPGVPLAIAEVYASRNQPDRAFEWLERSIPKTERQLKVKPCWVLLEDLQISPYLNSLHADARWVELVNAVKARLR
jgi:TolB-like protein/DNA-binding winged helix-turn-helix (wHTH) protein/tetratricopeptide (TPR) repeat protein